MGCRNSTPLRSSNVRSQQEHPTMNSPGGGRLLSAVSSHCDKPRACNGTASPTTHLSPVLPDWASISNLSLTIDRLSLGASILRPHQVSLSGVSHSEPRAPAQALAFGRAGRISTGISNRHLEATPSVANTHAVALVGLEIPDFHCRNQLLYPLYDNREQ